MKKRELRGFKIIRGEKNGSISLKLLAMNGNRFIVLINKYLLGMLWRTRSYEFTRREEAEFFYEKLSHHKVRVKSILF